MVRREDVISAYRMLLGREPENDAVISEHAKAKTLQILRQNKVHRVTVGS